jgi:hypothetical protein
MVRRFSLSSQMREPIAIALGLKPAPAPLNRTPETFETEEVSCPALPHLFRADSPACSRPHSSRVLPMLFTPPRACATGVAILGWLEADEPATVAGRGAANPVRVAAGCSAGSLLHGPSAARDPPRRPGVTVRPVQSTRLLRPGLRRGSRDEPSLMMQQTVMRPKLTRPSLIRQSVMRDRVTSPKRRYHLDVFRTSGRRIRAGSDVTVDVTVDAQRDSPWLVP